VDLQLISSGPLKYVDSVKIKVVSTSGWADNWKSYNLIGVFPGGVYYFDDQGNDSRFMVVPADGSGLKSGEPVYFGDRIRLLNFSYSEYLTRNSGDKFLTTQAALANKNIWIFEET
jgi:hypothetical protein